MDTILDAVFINSLRTTGGVYPPKWPEGVCWYQPARVFIYSCVS
jgi:hypothetical protein